MIDQETLTTLDYWHRRADLYERALRKVGDMASSQSMAPAHRILAILAILDTILDRQEARDE